MRTGSAWGTDIEGRSGEPRVQTNAGSEGDYSSLDINSRSLPDFFETTVATVVKPVWR